MRLWSSDESVERGEVSLLAVLETIAAVALTIYLAVREPITLPWLGWQVFGDWTHVVVAATIAPFLLLRTEKSTNLAVTFIDRAYKLVARPDMSEVVFLGLVPLVILAAPLMGKAVAVVVAVARWPRTTVLAIPHNWQRAVACVDLLRLPEVVPGLRSRTDPCGHA